MPNIRWLKRGGGAGYLILLTLLYLALYFLFLRHQEPAVTEIYFADRITDAHRILIDRYNAMNAGKVKVIPIDFPNKDFTSNERKEILARSLRGEGDGIDLFAVDVIWVQRFAKWCEPLEGYFSPEELSGIIPDGLYSCYADHKLVAVPLYLVQGVMYFREDLLKRVGGGDEIIRHVEQGMTWTDFVDLREKLKWKGPFFVFTAADYEGLICTYLEALLSLKPDYFTTYGFDFETPQARSALQLLVDLVQRFHASPEDVTRFTEVPSYEYFIRNDGLFIRGWNSFDRDFQNAPYDRAKEGLLRKAPVPYLSSGKPSSMFGGWDLMVSKFSKKKQAVIEFVKFLLRPDSQELFYSQSGFCPVVKSFYEDSSSVRQHPEVIGMEERMRTGVHRPPDKDYTNYSKIMSRYFAQAIRKEITVDDALESVNRAILSEKASVTGGSR